MGDGKVKGVFRQRGEQGSADLAEVGDAAVVHPEIAAEAEGVAGGLGDAHARGGGADVGKENRGDDLLRDGAEVGVVPGRADLLVDAGLDVGGVGGVPAEAEAVTVEIGRGGGIAGHALARVEALGDDAAGTGG